MTDRELLEKQDEIAFLYEGKLLSKARPRVTNKGTYMPKEYVEYKRDIQRQMVLCDFRPHPSKLNVAFFFKLPRSLSFAEKRRRLNDRHKQKPDLDNLIGAVMDALYPDGDSAICSIEASKIWTNDFEGFAILDLSDLLVQPFDSLSFSRNWI